MDRQFPYGGSRRLANEMQKLSAQRRLRSPGRGNYQGQSEVIEADVGHQYMSSKVEEQWQMSRDELEELRPMSPHMPSEGNFNILYKGRGSNSVGPFHQKPDLKMNQGNEVSKVHEQDMDIGYEDNSTVVTIDVLEMKFLDEIVNLTKEQNELEDAENARHREKLMEINIQYQEKILSLRAQQAKQREEFLHKELQARRHQYQSGLGHPPNNMGIGGTRSTAIPAGGEAHHAYATDLYDSYREQSRTPGAGMAQNREPRIQFSSGRVYVAGNRFY
ncbi:hypothetical protein RJ641_005207 [Dillenia turbinata]|uniref:Uncharacterized protein n=1 Tax=Dillenia turbinata TaxID=194707 RepID=A0AAN8VGJ7_9MAGN